MKSQLKELFTGFTDCFLAIEDVIITDTNIKFTFKGYISSHDITKLQNKLGIDSFMVKKHNYEKQEIIFTYNSVFDKD